MNGTRTCLNFGTNVADTGKFLSEFLSLGLLCLLSVLTIWSVDPVWDQLYECGVLAVLACVILRRSAMPPISVCAALTMVGLWGFLQLGTDVSVYRFATLQRTLQFMGLSATALAAYGALTNRRQLEWFLTAVTWLGCGVAVLGILTYGSSTGKVLWVFPSPYPDTWGPFLSRNNFAQFLELCLPASLWLTLNRSERWLYATTSAVMLGAGLASASRAGAALLIMQCAGALWLASAKRRWIALIIGAAFVLGGAFGLHQLATRITAAQPLGERLDLWRSTLRMVAERPWTGYGLGTYNSVYPEFAEFDSGYIIEHAHNEWLEWAAEGGVAFVFPWLYLLWRSVKSWRDTWTWGVASVLVHAAVDFPMARLGLAAWALFQLGVIEKYLTFKDLREN